MTRSAVLALLCDIAEAETIETTWALATSHFSSLGFARANYGFTRFRHARSIGDHEDALFLTTCDPAYAKRYFDDGFYARTPLFRWAETNTGICTWRWVKEAFDAGRLSAEETEAMRLNAHLGVTAGLSVSFPESSSRAKGALGLIADPGLDLDAVDEIFARHGDEIHTVAHMMHLRMVQLPHLAQGRALSPRQREALEWVADGKTTQDVALLMGVSPAMVEKHLRLVREALSVETTAQAVAKGALLNMIFHRPLGRQVAQAAG